MTINHHTRVRDMLAISELTSLELYELLELSQLMKSQPRGWLDALAGETVACFFQKPSTRTRVSLHGAIARLGGAPLLIRPDELQLGRGEPISDTARVLSGYACAIAARVFEQADLETMAEHSTVPVINALSDLHHPCQALADLLTMRERFGDLQGLRLAYVGDGNNVARSLGIAGELAGVEVIVAAPEHYQLEEGHGVVLTDDPRAAAANADALYTDVWVSMGDEDEARRRRADLAPYQLDADLLEAAKESAIVLHCLPAHPGEEITAEVLYGEHSAVWDQAENRLHAQKALLEMLLTE